MKTKEIKGSTDYCPECGSDRISYSNEVDIGEEANEVSLGCYCLDCSVGYDLVFVFAGRLVIEDQEEE
jgi:hypothetical protein